MHSWTWPGLMGVLGGRAGALLGFHGVWLRGFLNAPLPGGAATWGLSGVSGGAAAPRGCGIGLRAMWPSAIVKDFCRTLVQRPAAGVQRIALQQAPWRASNSVHSASIMLSRRFQIASGRFRLAR